MATRKQTRTSRYQRRTATQVHKDDFVFNEEQYTALGEEMAKAASQQASNAGTYWQRCRDMFVDAQDHGRQDDALRALFSPGDQVQGRKAPWYRTYKSILTSCMNLKIHVEKEHGVTTIQRLIKDAKDALIEADPHAKEAKDLQMVEMFRRLAQGCLNRGIEKQVLITALRELAAA